MNCIGHVFEEKPMDVYAFRVIVCPYSGKVLKVGGTQWKGYTVPPPGSTIAGESAHCDLAVDPDGFQWIKVHGRAEWLPTGSMVDMLSIECERDARMRGVA